MVELCQFNHKNASYRNIFSQNATIYQKKFWKMYFSAFFYIVWEPCFMTCKGDWESLSLQKFKRVAEMVPCKKIMKVRALQILGQTNS